MKKIGILTFHRACNYGAFLQMLSLSEKIERYVDTEVYLIDYRSNAIEDNYSVKEIFNIKNGIKSCILKFIRIKSIMKRNSIFDDYLNRTFKMISVTDINTLKEFYKFVVGSDQVWNFSLTGKDETYMLNFVIDNKKKVSYAASVGRLDQPLDIDIFRKHLEKYRAVSVREKELYNELNNKLQCQHLSLCVDPVFLKSKLEWRKYSGNEKLIKEKYILVFLMGVAKQCDYLVKQGKKLAMKENCRLILLGDQERWYKYTDIKHYGVATPDEFVNLIDNAKCVLTNSFHATAFSIIMNTDFFVELNIKNSGRIKSLLELTGLESRGMMNGNIEENSLKLIDWVKVESALAEEIKYSCEFIEKYIIE